MTIDHTGSILCDNETWMRIIGRIAFPLFAFCLSEGMHHTRDRKKYIFRMILFAVLSEFPYRLVGHKQGNIMCTFALAMCGIMIYEQLMKRFDAHKTVTMLVMVLPCIMAELFSVCYRMYGILVVYCMYFIQKSKKIQSDRAVKAVFITVTLILYPLIFGEYHQIASILAVPFIMCYNGKKGKNIPFFFYLYYPMHLVLLYLISQN